MLCGIEACLLKSILYECFVGKGLESGSRLGYEYEDRMSYVNICKYACCIIGIYV